MNIIQMGDKMPRVLGKSTIRIMTIMPTTAYWLAQCNPLIDMFKQCLWHGAALPKD
ncbi:hypothetical protein HMPREF1991_01724 [Hoylesella loescheii DSM 19665 = JCM 12249 = ATCC 15930]|uniref:Uncharacterized protein n=1 Tax=Hoylesella loescheii DSM 19665 = JCM 12249 = ATCC 15930 TaxID=1122985 RepID=A0A069QHG2_HOYLO|nr:hypothetical protein HMPREF1991_01724 [Hoylesella loescheii DSM 19665 = JCM 12249 = ATCC 15930]